MCLKNRTLLSNSTFQESKLAHIDIVVVIGNFDENKTRARWLRLPSLGIRAKRPPILQEVSAFAQGQHQSVPPESNLLAQRKSQMITSQYRTEERRHAMVSVPTFFVSRSGKKIAWHAVGRMLSIPRKYFAHMAH